MFKTLPSETIEAGDQNTAEAKIHKVKSSLERISKSLTMGVEYQGLFSNTSARQILSDNAQNCKSLLEEAKDTSMQLTIEDFPKRDNAVSHINKALQALQLYDNLSKVATPEEGKKHDQKITQQNQKLADAIYQVNEAIDSLSPEN